MAENSQLFFERHSAGELIVRDLPKFDLENYISNYSNRTRLYRLGHIALTCPPLSKDAFHAGIDEAKQGIDVDYYMNMVDGLHKLDPEDPKGTVDIAWVEQKTKEIKANTERLEGELKAYKNNLIKESIRMGTNDLATHFTRAGDFQSANKTYSRIREYCTTPVHIASLALRLLLLSIYQRDWMGVQTQCIKLSGQQLKPEERLKLSPIIATCTGLSYMGIGEYGNAAKSFLDTDPSYLTLSESVENIVPQREIMTPNDVAVYGGLCALASMDRAELQTKVLENAPFRQFLELEPHIRRVITLFCGSKYKQALEILESYRADWTLDLYLATHVAAIFGRVRQKSIVQYFVPFSCVTLDEMQRMFGARDVPIEDELAEMIGRGILNARLDLVDRLLLAPPSIPRSELHTSALQTARTYERALKLRLLRLNMQASGLEVKNQKALMQQGSSGLTEMDVGDLAGTTAGGRRLRDKGRGWR